MKNYFLFIFLISIFSFLSWGCQVDNSPQVLSSQDCRQVKHTQGTTCIPKQWENLVTLDFVTAENALTLGITPQGTTFSNLSQHLTENLRNVAYIGNLGEPNLETIVKLNPDLIVGIDSQENIYGQLSQIAPTVLIESEHSGQWKEVLQRFSTMVGKEDKAEEVMKAYQARIADFKAKMGDRLQDTQVSVVKVYPDSINLYLRDSFAGTILTDAGLPRPESQDISAEEALKIARNPIQMTISNEALTKADADVIFIWTGENDPQIDREAQQKLLELQQDPLWQNLKAVQNGRVYQVPSYWIGSSAIAANLVLDDLFKYLIPLENSQFNNRE